MKKVYICRFKNHEAEVRGDGGKEYGVAFEKYLSEHGRQFPQNLLGLNYSGCIYDSEGHTLICYTDFSEEQIKQISRDFEYFFITSDEIVESCLKMLGIKQNEIKEGWEKALNRAELNMVLLSFGRWKIMQSPFDYVKNGKLDSELAKEAFLKKCVLENVECLSKVKDWLLQLKEVSTFDELADVLNRCSEFPSGYFRRMCVKNGWRMKGLDFGEMCTDEKHILRMGSDGKVEIV